MVPGTTTVRTRIWTGNKSLKNYLSLSNRMHLIRFNLASKNMKTFFKKVNPYQTTGAHITIHCMLTNVRFVVCKWDGGNHVISVKIQSRLPYTSIICVYSVLYCVCFQRIKTRELANVIGKKPLKNRWNRMDWQKTRLKKWEKTIKFIFCCDRSDMKQILRVQVIYLFITLPAKKKTYVTKF